MQEAQAPNGGIKGTMKVFVHKTVIVRWCTESDDLEVDPRNPKGKPFCLEFESYREVANVWRKLNREMRLPLAYLTEVRDFQNEQGTEQYYQDADEYMKKWKREEEIEERRRNAGKDSNMFFDVHDERADYDEEIWVGEE